MPQPWLAEGAEHPVTGCGIGCLFGGPWGSGWLQEGWPWEAIWLQEAACAQAGGTGGLWV